jgi:hypothetical protein
VIGRDSLTIDLDRSIPYTYWKATEAIRPGRGFKEDKIPFEWFRGSWLMSILEEGGFGIKIGPGADLGIKASVSTVDIYAKADTLVELVQR